MRPGVVAEHGVGVERQVVGREREVVPEQGLQPAAGRGASTTGLAPSQNRPWCTSSSWAPAAPARSKTSSDGETATATRRTSSAPTTCRPLGP